MFLIYAALSVTGSVNPSFGQLTLKQVASLQKNKLSEPYSWFCPKATKYLLALAPCRLRANVNKAMDQDHTLGVLSPSTSGATLPKSNVALAALKTPTNISKTSPVFPGELHVTSALR